MGVTVTSCYCLLYNEFVIFSLSMNYGLFVYLFLAKCLLKSFAHLKTFCTCYWVVGIIYIFWVLVPYRIRFASIIAHCGLTFDSIDSVLWRIKVLNFDKSNLDFYLLMSGLLMLYPRNHCEIQCHETFSVCFFLRVL